MKKKLVSILLILTMVLTLLPGTALAATATLDRAWTADQDYTLEGPAPWDLDELKQVVDVKDPRSVAAYWVWAVNRLVDNYDDGMDMMKYLFADIEPYGRGFTEGGMSGKAGWDTYFNERLKSDDYKWLPRAYFKNAKANEGFTFHQPLTVALHYNATNTETINGQTLSQLGRLNIVYWVQSGAAGNQVNITLSKFDGSDRWYVTSGTSSTALFYDQRSGVSAAVLAAAESAAGDASTQAEHTARYGGGGSPSARDNPFTDIDEGDYCFDAVLWAYDNDVTKGNGADTFGPDDVCSRSQVVTFLWRAMGEPQPESTSSAGFTDLDQDWYKKAVAWAVEKGITNGSGNNTFLPNDPCTGAQIITFIYRAFYGLEASQGGSAYYSKAYDWAKANGIVEGTPFSLTGECSRGLTVEILYRQSKLN